jgi:ABC-type enterochelin transport system ATPase subunit
LGAYVLPTLPFNTSEEHASFKGTVSLRPSTLMLVLEEVVGELRIQGFRKQVLTVGHSGALWVGAFVKHVNRRFGDVVVVDAHRGCGPVWVGSGLDMETQRTLSEQLRVLAQHKTVIVSTHGMPAMLMADRIYRMEGGRIVEEDRGEAVLTRLEGT